VKPLAARRIAWFALFGALLVLAYSYLGYVMVASLAVASEERLADYRTAARIYLGLMATALVTVIGAVVYLLRSRGRGESSTSHLTSR
jgi:ABC-type sulfate transport system permease component